MMPKETDDFITNAELILADIELETTRKSVTIYFDTADVRDALLGMDAFYTLDNTFNRESFKQRRVLVQSLASAGWLGPFSLLPPHQAEFLNLLNLDFGFRRTDGSPADRAARFLIDADIYPEKLALSNLNREQIRDVIKRQAGSAERFFKAVQCVGGTWQTRLSEWRAKGTIALSAKAQNYALLVSSDEFLRLKQFFDRERPDRPINNFADAAALTVLIWEFTDFREEKSSRFPCLYGTTLITEAVTACGFADALRITLPSGIRASALRSSDYFILRSIVWPRGASAKSLLTNTPPALSMMNIQDIHARVQEIVAARSPLPQDAIDRLDFFGRSLVSIIRDLNRLSFFEQVWLPYSAEPDTHRAFDQLRTAVKIAGNDNVRRVIREEVKQVRKELDINAEGYRIVKNLWTELLPKFRSLAVRMKLDDETEVINRFGLHRFGLPSVAHPRITTLVHYLLSTELTTEATALVQVVKSYWDARETHAAAEAPIACGVLWIGEMYRYIIDLLRDPKRPRHFSLDLMFAAAAIHSGKELESGIARVVALERQYSGPRIGRQKGDLASGLAYVYHHLWLRVIQTRSAATVVRKLMKRGPAQVIDRAVSLAKEARGFLRGADEAKAIYALNQYLFYMVESHRPRRIVDMREAAESLLQYRGLTDLWSYRYDDTLARYFLILSDRASDGASKIMFLSRARDRVEASWHAAAGDPQVQKTIDLVALRESTPIKLRGSARVRRKV